MCKPGLPKNMLKIFKIRHEERWIAVGATVYAVVLNALVYIRYGTQYAQLSGDGAWNTFSKTFLVSGFDPTGWGVLTQWDEVYNIRRHPLMAVLMYIPSLINQGLTALTGVNCALPIYAIILLFCTVYSAIFLYRILREGVQLQHLDALLLTMLCFSLGYVMLACCLPDHFGLSMLLLIATIYFATDLWNQRSSYPCISRKRSGQWALLLTIVSGVSLSNSVKVLLAGWMSQGRRFWQPRHLFLAVVVPIVFLGGFTWWEYAHFEVPKQEAAQARFKARDKAIRDSIYQAVRDSTGLTDEAAIQAEVKKVIHRRIMAKYRSDRKKPWNQHAGKAMVKKGMLAWTDVSTPRWASLVDNWFGEPIQIHRDHLLEDVLRGRPVFVGYQSVGNYVVEGIIVLLLLLGIWHGRRERLLWLALSFMGCDLLLHVGLGFGLNEVYIMSPHWLFVLPIAIGYWLREASLKQWMLMMNRGIVIVLSAFLFIWNLAAVATYFTSC